LISKNKITLALILSSFIGVSISFSDLYLFHIFLIISSLVWLYEFKNNKYLFNYSFFLKKYVKTLILILLWYFLSLLWAPDKVLGLKYLFYLICGFVTTASIIVFSSNIKNLNIVYKLLSMIVFIEIVIAFLESFAGFRMPISSYSSLSTFFGKDPVNFSEFDGMHLYTNLSPPTGFRWNTNDLAISMAIALPFFLCSKRTIVQIFGIISISTIVIMTASRAVFLSIILIFSLYLLLIKKRLGTLSIIWITSIGLIFSLSVFSNSENPRLNELGNSLEALNLYIRGEIDVGGSIEWRRELVKDGLEAFKKTYGRGLGSGGSVANQELVGPVAGRFTSMHNFWIEILVEGGALVFALGSTFLISLVFNLFIIARSNLNGSIKYLSQSLFLSLTAFIPAAIAASSTVYFFPMWILFGLSISVINLSKEN